MATKTQDTPQNRCPYCAQGTGYVRGVQSAGALKILIYVCQTCEHRWHTSERWLDEWWYRKSTDLPAIGDSDIRGAGSQEPAPRTLQASLPKIGRKR